MVISGTNLSTIKQGIKCINNTKIPFAMPKRALKLQGIRFEPKLAQDSLTITTSPFSELEQKLINEIKDADYEHIRLINSKGEHIKVKYYSEKTQCFIDPTEAFTSKLKNSTYIHNHPENMPLSASDVFVMAHMDINKIIACTKDGGYSLLERLPNASDVETSFCELASGLKDEEIKYIEKLRHARGITDLERAGQLNEWRYKNIGNLAQKCNLNFENKINPLTEADDIENIFHISPIHKLIDKIIILRKNILHN